MQESNSQALQDDEPDETREWLEALSDVLEFQGEERVRYLLEKLQRLAQCKGVSLPSCLKVPYLNTISPAQQPDYPGDIAIETKLMAWLRWNAMAIVVRGGHREPQLGGHIATYASAAVLYEVGFNHIFNAASESHGGDLLFIQGHSSPGIYARAFFEGRLSQDQLDHFRQEVEVDGLSSYPHPWLMPHFWQFPTVSMGLGPLQSIYTAHFLRYLHHRGLVNTEGRKVFTFCGDGEMDEPESLGAITLAARENLDNLVFVINCNLQRLDGPVRGNASIIRELEGVFRGAGWNVIKLLWDSHWDDLFAKDEQGVLLKRLEEAVDGEYQNFKARDGAWSRENFFGKYPELRALVEHLSDEEITGLEFGGHDLIKVYAAYHQAIHHKGQPTVILAKTIKGYGMGKIGQGQNTTHQQKKLSTEDIMAFRDRFHIPIKDKDIAEVPYYVPDMKGPEISYLKAQRQKLGGFLPARRGKSEVLQVPDLDAFAHHLEGTGEREISTTMGFVRILNSLLKDKHIADRIVPIIPDECRTFGMEGMFRQFGIYAPFGQRYRPVDAEQLMFYREDQKGQVLEEGLTEAGGFSSWLAAATSYSTNNFPMIPFFIYYSMFGFQRIGDLAWAAGDMRARGFLLGGTAGRTTLAGEGLQHQDGQSLTQAGLIPNCICYDPTYDYELAVIIQDGLRRMYREQEDVYYYITLMNENYTHPPMPEGAQEGILKGMYLLKEGKVLKHKVQLLGSGTILREVIKAAEILAKEYQVSADIWSVPSFTEVAREGRAVERHNRMHPKNKRQTSYVSQCLDERDGVVVAATDYVREYADQIRGFFSKPYTVLGTDGFGRSDSRERLRHFFEVDAKFIVLAVLNTLEEQGTLDKKVVAKAMGDLGINPDKPDPVQV